MVLVDDARCEEGSQRIRDGESGGVASEIVGCATPSADAAAAIPSWSTTARKFTIWYSSTRRLYPASSGNGPPVAVSPSARAACHPPGLDAVGRLIESRLTRFVGPKLRRLLSAPQFNAQVTRWGLGRELVSRHPHHYIATLP